jgi:XTP/dITP diphosphohydrolase
MPCKFYLRVIHEVFIICPHGKCAKWHSGVKMTRIVLATTNQGKVKEIQPFVEKFSIELIAQSELSVSEIPETGQTFIENALLKARHACKTTGLPAIADDSGILVKALNNMPGLYSARYAGMNALSHENNQKLLEAMKGIQDREAFFYCVMVYLREEHDPAPIIGQGVWKGSILFEPQGEKGFGYDPVFYVPSYHCSAAELPLEEKNKISHRGKALLQLLEQYSVL